MSRSLAVRGSFVLLVGFVVHAAGLDVTLSVNEMWESFVSHGRGYDDVDEVRVLSSIQTLGTVLMVLGAALVLLDAHQRGVAKRWKE